MASDSDITRGGPAATGPAVLCYDGSDEARHAIEVAGELLGGGPAVVVTIWEPYGPSLLAPVGSTIGVAAGLAKEFDEVSVDLARKTADEGVAHAAGAGFEDPRPVIAHGKPRDAILEAADEQGARVIVMGNRGQGGAESAIFGSVSTAVLHRSAVPVLVVRG
jgi:nucleotide-binding universal stress UspA family protein